MASAPGDQPGALGGPRDDALGLIQQRRNLPRAVLRGGAGMRRRISIWGVIACGVAALGPAPAALAATPQQIYRDYAQHGRLTHNYSRSDLERALRDAALQGYPRVGVQGAVQQALGAQAVKSRGGLPFTGLAPPPGPRGRGRGRGGGPRAP